MGLLFGSDFDGIQIAEADDRYPTDGLHYCFNMFNGIMVTSIVIFFTYGIISRNNPYVLPKKAFLPSIISGLMWGLAQILWTVANQKNMLGLTATFPIVNTGPNLVAALWSVFVYKE